MTDTANLGLPCIEGSQAQKHVTHNEALRILDTLVQLAVKDRDLAAPPGSPAEGDRYIIKTGATGAWAAHVDEIAFFQDGGWQFAVPRAGWLAYVVDEGALLAWSGGAWVDAIAAMTSLNNMALLGVCTTADATNPFSVKLNNVLSVAKTVAEGGDGHLRYTLSKESAAKTLSFLFQDNYSGRAEIGLTGDDDFHFKVSPDGTTWRDAIVIDRNTGQVSFPQGSAGGDLELTLAELSLGVADALNTARFLGESGNRFADSFDALTFVDTGAAVNLDSGTAGLLKPSLTAGAMIPQATGAAIHNADANPSIFCDGNTNQIGSLSTAAFSRTSFLVGKNYSASPKRIGRAKAYGSSNSGYAAVAATITIELRGHSAAPSTGGEGTLLGNVSFADTDSTNAQTVVSGDQVTAWPYVWLRVMSSVSTDLIIAEAEFYEPDQPANLMVASSALTAAAAPSTAKLVARVKEIDAIALNTDLVFSASRDGGANYTAFTMIRKYTSEAVAVYESQSLAIAAQPDGTAMKWRCASANNRNFELRDVYFYWS